MTNPSNSLFVKYATIHTNLQYRGVGQISNISKDKPVWLISHNLYLKFKSEAYAYQIQSVLSVIFQNKFTGRH